MKPRLYAKHRLEILALEFYDLNIVAKGQEQIQLYPKFRVYNPVNPSTYPEQVTELCLFHQMLAVIKQADNFSV